jgi:hypothetical protein
VPGLLVRNIQRSLERPDEALDAPILSQGTNQARRGSRKRPDPPCGFSDGPGDLATTCWAAGHDQLTNAPLAARFGAAESKKKAPGVRGFKGSGKESSAD